MANPIAHNEHLDLRLIGEEKKTKDSLVDIIFVHGIGGDWFTTWNAGPKDSKDLSNYWPAWLSEDISEAHVWSLDYPAPFTRWTSRDEQGMPLPERAKSIIDLLLSHGIGARSLIFVAHSLGGLMVKQILRASHEFRTPEWEKIAGQTRAAVFIATPHTGAGLVNLGKALKRIPGLGFVLRWSDTAEAMEKDCSHLLDLATWYRQNAHALGIDTKVYYEKAPLAGVGLVVSESSADPGVQDCIPVPVDGDHLSIVKPPGRSSAIYKGIRELLKNRIADLEKRQARQKTLIVIDDEPAVREAVQITATRVLGLAIQPLSNVTSKESLFRHLSQLRPDGIILDLDVPPGGTEIRKWLHDWSAKLPVVFYTRHADHPDTINKMLAVGARYEDIFSKQDTAKDIQSIIQRFQQCWTTLDDTPRNKNEIVLETEGQKFSRANPTLPEVGKALTEFTTRMSNPEDWESVLALNAVGEIRTPDDWGNFPRDQDVRVILLRDSKGLVLRWSHDDKLEKSIRSICDQQDRACSDFERNKFKRQLQQLHSRIITHEHLATYEPKTLSELRSGYIRLTKDNELIVITTRGHTMFRM
jgi:FixJ family two-component response regulator